MEKTEMPMIYAKMASILAEIDPVAKDRKNEFQGFKYRGIEEIFAAASVAMAKHGVFVVPEVATVSSEERKNAKGGYAITRIATIKYTFFAADGSSVSAIVCGEGTDSSDKAMAKAFTAAIKTALTSTFVLRYQDMVDGDAESVETTPKEVPAHKPKKDTPPPAAQPKTTPSASSAGVEMVRFGKYKGMPVDELSDENLQWYRDAIKKSVDDPTRSNFLASNKSHLEVIDRIIYGRSSVPPGWSPTDEDIPF
jgi:hypothetical protein